MDMEQRMNSVLRQEQQMGGNFIDHKWWSGGGGVFDFHPQFHQCDESETKQNVLDGKKNICAYRDQAGSSVIPTALAQQGLEKLCGDFA